ncbi:dihydroneopterin triphosphate diphosphatase [Thiocapsa bogorovii]|uniref:dihydroneopterin triphosphate diphosphatase n=1 Tax=Thiocapsa bogorovii TaxID=521689 RepID=UPI001E59F595|nr:dihydroneopterin triphosphate diphosphatase [Thiocapsa bogorovii]UHD18085.1 dihydroneopterin triphosphate diphosphatase [Thiocapsa bogorovii]
MAVDAAGMMPGPVVGDSVRSVRSLEEARSIALAVQADEPPLEPASMSDETRKRAQSVLVVICTRGGEFLLLKRTRPAGFWQSVTGSLAPGESPRHAAAREVFEETGLLVGGALIDLHHSNLFPIIQAWRKRYAPNVCFNREYWFALMLETRRLIRLNPREHTQYRWLAAQPALALATSRTNRDAIRGLAGIAW